MIETGVQPETGQTEPKRNWTGWIVAGGCRLLLCLLVGIAALGGYMYLSGQGTATFNPAIHVNTPAPRAHPQASGNTLGAANAPVKITEYADFQCPYCEQYWRDTEPQIVAAYVQTGKVQYTYRSAGNLVSSNIGSGNVESQDAAMAAYCAGDQNKFWEYHDALYSNVLGEGAGSFTDERLKAIAHSLGLDSNQFGACYDGKTYAARATQDLQDANKQGFQGTPFFVITYTLNGQTQTKTIDGAYPFSQFQQVIDAALGGQ